MNLNQISTIFMQKKATLGWLFKLNLINVNRIKE